VRQFPARLFLDFTMTYKLKITLMVAQIVSATFNAKQAVALTTAEVVAADPHFALGGTLRLFGSIAGHYRALHSYSVPSVASQRA
jgi:hypothetical protein